MLPPPSPDALIGARYRLEQPVGEGAAGVVWAAVDESSGERVAVKILRSEAPLVLGRFRREARALAALRHPGVVRVVDVVEEGGQLGAIVTELLSGETLRARLGSAAPPLVAEAARIVRDVATAVAFAHGAGVLHRDLKPENVFLTADGRRVVVLDFGLTRWLEREPSGSVLTQLGERLGTLPYMAPEQLTDASTVDEAADVWAIGILLYECLAGFRPLEGRSEPDLVRRILTEAIAPLSTIAPQVPAALSQLASRLLSRDREERRVALPGAIQVLAAHATG